MYERSRTFYPNAFPARGRTRDLAPEAGSVTADTTISRCPRNRKIGYRYPLTISNGKQRPKRQSVCFPEGPARRTLHRALPLRSCGCHDRRSLSGTAARCRPRRSRHSNECRECHDRASKEQAAARVTLRAANSLSPQPGHSAWNVLGSAARTVICTRRRLLGSTHVKDDGTL